MRWRHIVIQLLEDHSEAEEDKEEKEEEEEEEEEEHLQHSGLSPQSWRDQRPR
jgi:hypothetical protein